jgi:hypothetical protein
VPALGRGCAPAGQATRQAPPDLRACGAASAAASRIDAEAQAARQRLLDQAKAAGTRALGEARAAGEAARVAAYSSLAQGSLLALAAKDLAGSLPQIGSVVLAPDLLTPLLTKLATAPAAPAAVTTPEPVHPGPRSRSRRRRSAPRVPGSRRPVPHPARRNRLHQQAPARPDDRAARRHGLHPSQMTYDLRRLRLNGLIRRLPHTNRYTLTGDGIRIAVFYTKVYNRLLVPLTAANQPQAPPELRAVL